MFSSDFGKLQLLLPQTDPARFGLIFKNNGTDGIISTNDVHSFRIPDARVRSPRAYGHCIIMAKLLSASIYSWEPILTMKEIEFNPTLSKELLSAVLVNKLYFGSPTSRPAAGVWLISTTRIRYSYTLELQLLGLDVPSNNKNYAVWIEGVTLQIAVWIERFRNIAARYGGCCQWCSCWC